ncbi:multidrug efflux RND transporter permease subunit [Zestomonas thermotolerans]|uniref:multidrug efflux RND transporter permease subunit n=1 Tax=Zestomonas thermotolerans TaxID=157784 RepID=UPI0023F19A21|nr:multidrug efflux RND transporter permease subunit [Pseudomonas thermotolerans]
MAFTDPFIRRPVLATVVSLLIVLLGMQAFNKLVIRQYPQMENALITVTTSYPGANAETIQGYITQPLQQSLASAEGIDYMTSSSQQNISVIQIYARIGANTDRLFTELLAKANEVKNQLPQDAEDPVLSKEAADASALMYISFYSDELSNPQITDYLARVIQPKLATLPGMAEAQILGNQVFAMRLWLDPVRMAAYGVTASDVAEAVRKYNFLSAAGEVKGQYVVTSINASTDLKTPEAFGAIPVKTAGDRRVLMRDIARVEMGAESYNSIDSFDGIPSVYIAIKATPTANPLDVIKEVRAILPELEQQLPPNLKVAIAYDATEFIQESIDEVIKTLGEAVLIVIVVVFLFLGALRSVLIPVVTIPLSMIGVLFFMQMMGYSINLLTLLAMVLAIGLVVDDAIVVVENIHRHIEEGKTPFDAAIEGAREIAVPVISMTITLAAVYAPIGFLEGLTGALFKEFALTLAGAVIISGVVALTLSPMMCSRLLRHEENPSGLAHRLDLLFEALKRRYQRALHGTLETRPVVLTFAAIVLLLIPALLSFTQSELAPEEDQGVVFLFANAPQPTNLDYLNAYTNQFLEIFRSFPEYYSSFQINGFDGVQTGIGGFLLKPWSERERSQMEILPEVQAQLDRKIPGLQIFGFNLPSLPGTGEGLPFQFVINTPNDYESLLQVAERIKARAEASGKFAFLNIDLAFDKPEVVVDIDREKAAQMGVSMQDLGSTLAILLGEGEINRFTIDGRSYKVIAQVERPYRDNPGWLNSYYVKSESGQMVPLATLISVRDRARPTRLKQFQQLNSAIIEGFPVVSMGEAIDTVTRIAHEEAPRGFAFDYAGASRQYVQEGSALYVTFGLALAIIFLVLAAQFESFRDPLVILITVPLSVCGALVPLFLGVSSMNIYTQVGLVTLIGLISKHGILIVEFANQLRRQGRPLREAIEEAAAIRLRPVLMTTAAMVFGMVPLLLATGAGAVSRFDIGLVIATGMSVGTLFTLFVLPCVYTLLARPDQKAPQPQAEVQPA